MQWGVLRFLYLCCLVWFGFELMRKKRAKDFLYNSLFFMAWMCGNRYCRKLALSHIFFLSLTKICHCIYLVPNRKNISYLNSCRRIVSQNFYVGIHSTAFHLHFSWLPCEFSSDAEQFFFIALFSWLFFPFFLFAGLGILYSVAICSQVCCECKNRGKKN